MTNYQAWPNTPKSRVFWCVRNFTKSLGVKGQSRVRCLRSALLSLESGRSPAYAIGVGMRDARKLQPTGEKR